MNSRISNPRNRTHLSASQALFTIFFLIFFFTLVNGYLQNLVADYRANTWLVLGGVVVEMTLTLWIGRRLVDVEFNPLEAAGFLLVIVSVWLYFLMPAWPTLLPPTKSSDAVRVFLQVLFSFPEGKLVSWYPAGGAFVTAMLSNWIGWDPLRVLHPTAASFVALGAGAVYGITSTLLPNRRISKIAALFAPALLFIPWSYFAGTIDWEQYFFAQVFAQYFILAACWYIACYAEQPRWVLAALIGAALLSVVAAYPIFVALPLGLFALVVAAHFTSTLLKREAVSVNLPPETLTRLPEPPARSAGRTLLALGGILFLMVLAALALQRGGILELRAGKLSVIQDVGAGGVATPSLDSLGGPVFLLLALAGMILAWRAGVHGKTVIGLLVVWLLQFIALLAIRTVVPISGYRVDKTFYILVFPLAVLGALPLAWLLSRVTDRIITSSRRAAVSLVFAYVLLCAAVLVARPPKAFSPLTESELQVAFWAREFYSYTYQISYFDEEPISAYWLAFGIWREKIPDEWFQWIPAGRKLGPATFEDWLQDPAWPDRLLVRYLDQVPAHLRVVYQSGDSAILDRDTPPILDPQPPHRSDMNFDNTATLIGYDLPRRAFAPGEMITLTTYTQTQYPPQASVGWRVELLDHNGNVVSKVEREPFGNKYPIQRWPPGRYMLDRWALPLGPTLSPGIYDLRMALFQRVNGELIDVVPAFSTDVVPPMPAAQIARIKIPLASPSAEELRTAKPLQARVGTQFSLTSYLVQADAASRQAHLTLYWRSLAKTETNYTVFVHLLDSSGKLVAQIDEQPRGGAYPTSIWDVGETVKAEYDLTIPPGARGPFSIQLGMYEQPSLQRLQIGSGDHLTLDLNF